MILLCGSVALLFDELDLVKAFWGDVFRGKMDF